MLPVEISIVIKMEQLKFETSMKNIPLGGNKEYVMQLTQSVRKVVYAMSWAAFILRHPLCIYMFFVNLSS